MPLMPWLKADNFAPGELGIMFLSTLLPGYYYKIVCASPAPILLLHDVTHYRYNLRSGCLQIDPAIR
jgi:hypothetical protein